MKLGEVLSGGQYTPEELEVHFDDDEEDPVLLRGPCESEGQTHDWYLSRKSARALSRLLEQASRQRRTSGG